jgi:predicted aspartyl protease
MNQVSVKFIVDTGCPITIINEQTFKHIGAKYIDKQVEHKIKTANGSLAKVLGYTNKKTSAQ